MPSSSTRRDVLLYIVFTDTLIAMIFYIFLRDYLLLSLIISASSILLTNMLVLFKINNTVIIKIRVPLELLFDITSLIVTISLIVIPENMIIVKAFNLTVFLLLVPGYFVLSLASCFCTRCSQYIKSLNFIERLILYFISSLFLLTSAFLTRYVLSSWNIYQVFVAIYINSFVYFSILLSLCRLFAFWYFNKETKRLYKIYILSNLDLITVLVFLLLFFFIVTFNWAMSTVCCITDYPAIYRMMLIFILKGAENLSPYPLYIGMLSLIHVYLYKLPPFILFKAISLGATISILSMYYFYKRILKDKKSLILALIIWIAGGGFSWLLLLLKGSKHLYTIYPEGLGYWIWIYFRALTLGFSMFIIFMTLLLDDKTILRNKFIVFMLIFLLPFIHISEYIVAIITLIIIGSLRRQSVSTEIVLASILASIASLITLFAIGFYMYSFIVLLLLIFQLLMSFGFTRYFLSKTLSSVYNVTLGFLTNKSFIKITLLFAILSPGFFILYNGDIDLYMRTLLWTLFPVPISLYSIVIGPIVFLFLLYMYVQGNTSTLRYRLMLAIIVALFIIAKIITIWDFLDVLLYIEKGSYMPVYFEERFLALIYPLMIAFAVNILLNRKSTLIKIISVFLISLCFIGLPIYVNNIRNLTKIFSLDTTEIETVNELVKTYYNLNGNVAIYAAPGLLIRKMEYFPSVARTEFYNDVIFSTTSLRMFYCLLNVYKERNLFFVIDERAGYYLNMVYNKSFLYRELIPQLREYKRINSIVIYLYQFTVNSMDYVCPFNKHLYVIRNVTIEGVSFVHVEHGNIVIMRNNHKLLVRSNASISICCRLLTLGSVNDSSIVNITCHNILFTWKGKKYYIEGKNNILFNNGLIVGEGNVSIKELRLLPTKYIPRYILNIFNTYLQIQYQGKFTLKPIIQDQYILGKKFYLYDLYSNYLFKYFVYMELTPMLSAFSLSTIIALLVDKKLRALFEKSSQHHGHPDLYPY